MLWHAKHRHTQWSRSRRPPSETHWMRTQCSVLPSHTWAALCLSLLACPGREVASTTSGGNPGTGATPAKLTAHPPPGALATVPRAARTPFKSWAIVTRHLCHKNTKLKGQTLHSHPVPQTGNLKQRKSLMTQLPSWEEEKETSGIQLSLMLEILFSIQVNRADHRIS